MSKSGIPIVSDVAKVVGHVVKPVAKALRPIAPILPFIPIPGMFGLSSLLTRSLLTGALGGMDKKGNFNLGRGLTSGLLSYGLGSMLGPSTAAASGAPTSAGLPSLGDGAFDVSGVGTGVDASAGLPSLAATGPTAIGPTTNYAAAETIPTVDVTRPGFETVGGAAPIETPTSVIPGVGAESPTPSVTESLSNLAGEAANTAGSYAVDAGKYVLDQAIKNPIQAASLAFTGYGAIKSKEELERQKAEADRILADQANQKAETVAQARQFLQEYPLMYQRLTAEDVRSRGLAAGGMATYDDELGMDDGMAMGGIAALAGGGMPPRYLRGGGDGMSDSIPARISGKQEARLADGEFVVPADVVSHIGNGSSNAGAKKLYAMMDRARQARTGKTRQAPAINAQRYMPA